MINSQLSQQIKTLTISKKKPAGFDMGKAIAEAGALMEEEESRVAAGLPVPEATPLTGDVQEELTAAVQRPESIQFES